MIDHWMVPYKVNVSMWMWNPRWPIPQDKVWYSVLWNSKNIWK